MSETVPDLVRGHYRRQGLADAVLDALEQSGVDTASLTASDLAPIDQLHAGGAPATAYLLGQLGLDPHTRLLDVGCGIGGPARLAAASFSCPVVGIDLSPDFVEAARTLTDRVGLTPLVEHRVSSGESLAFEDATFDRAMLIHVGMNIPDKATVFAEVHRVLRPGGVFGLYEQMRTADGDLPYPLPWSEDERCSFVETPETYGELLRTAGFTVEKVENRMAAQAGPGAGPSQLSPATVFGPGFTERIGNNMAAARAGRLAPMVMLARAA